jgi:pyruvate carboxylase
MNASTDDFLSVCAVFELNGEVRAIVVEDRDAAIEHVAREKAPNDPGSVGSPMAGVVLEVRVKEGQNVKAGDPLAVLSAMKMESVVSSPVSGRVARILVNPSDSIGQGDLIVEIKH